MLYRTSYRSPLGEIRIVSDGETIKELWLAGQRGYEGALKYGACGAGRPPVLEKAAQWLDRYFAGERPLPEELPLAPEGSAFRREVWEILCRIPYGKVTAYGEIAKKIAARRGIEKMAAQAVGNAVGHNPVSIVIPCHRVVGTDGSMIGYGGGIPLKEALLSHEGVDVPSLKNSSFSSKYLLEMSSLT